MRKIKIHFTHTRTINQKEVEVQSASVHPICYQGDTDTAVNKLSKMYKGFELKGIEQL